MLLMLLLLFYRSIQYTGLINKYPFIVISIESKDQIAYPNTTDILSLNNRITFGYTDLFYVISQRFQQAFAEDVKFYLSIDLE